ncbi:hypothetical protein [Croceimicrobium hydrocarbonivorans]|uniref:VCBS repeat-containing protein n=1 Tax=Croceimicrobium hydrocarbonivorans TaxID=2761580 RepID=A0A7H0VHF8_9FLAO|nr:hypothetical protein [Croceimicrobium hydrocarbonivorans]QNR25156.1 hypothetical protein H4K34_04775 [Croceimicrobium hydrocarbonivorans]
MKNFLLIPAIALVSWTAKGQYPFEKYPTPKYEHYNDWKTFDKSEKERKVHSTLTIPQFFTNGDTLSLQLTSFTDHWLENSIIRIFRNGIETQKLIENMAFVPHGLDTLRVADINGDGLQDIKIISAYMGSGTAAMNVRVIYLFQQSDTGFQKISFADKMSSNRKERDFDGDKNFEIITLNLIGYEGHSYWLFNLFNNQDAGLESVNNQHNYPILIQFLKHPNYEITNKISRDKMKSFALKFPDDYHAQ